MISIPLWAFLTAYLVFLLIFLLFSFANVYHIYSTGTFTFAAGVITVLVSAWCLVILAATYTAIVAINWNVNAVFFGPGGLLIFQ